MFEIIVLAVGVIVSLVGGAIAAQKNKLANAQAIDEAYVQYQENRNLTLDSLAATQKKLNTETVIVIAIAAIAFFVIIFIVRGNRK